jgi:hypothetical protein
MPPRRNRPEPEPDQQPAPPAERIASDADTAVRFVASYTIFTVAQLVEWSDQRGWWWVQRPEAIAAIDRAVAAGTVRRVGPQTWRSLGAPVS